MLVERIFGVSGKRTLGPVPWRNSTGRIWEVILVGVICMSGAIGGSCLTADEVISDQSSPRTEAQATGQNATVPAGVKQLSAGAGIPLKSADRVVAFYQDRLVRNPDDQSPWYDRSGFVHPLVTPGGRVVTEVFAADHPHQHAIMMAWTSSHVGGRKVDFWNSQRRQGHVEHVETLRQDADSLTCQLQHVDDTVEPPRVALTETWHLEAIPHEAVNVFDLASTQIKATSETFVVQKYHYGGLCVRGSGQWSGRVSMLTSELKTIEDGNHTRPRWVAMYGPVDDTNAGVDAHGICGLAAMSHPSNFRYPQHARLHPEMPYFSFFPAVESGFEIKTGTPYRSRFRFVAFDGEPDVRLLNEICDDFDNKKFGIGGD